MRKVAILVFAVVFAACLFHFFYAEDHCPVHCASKGGRFGHVHPHHAGASACLCFWSSLFGPETGDVAGAMALVAVMSPPPPGRPLSRLSGDIAHPPRAVLV